MKLSLALSVFACALTVVASWSKEDQEIFRLRDEIALSEGPEVTFYDFLGLPRNANHDDITKAYKKRSLQLHPDKVKQRFIASRTSEKGKKGSKPGVHVNKRPSKAEIDAAAKAASDRFARLGLVQKLLKGPERERYDHFLSNGFPTWKGTGYYYARFRPGFGTVLTGLFIFVGGAAHYFALYMSWKRQQEFVGRYVKFARRAAWGDNLNVPGLDTVAATGNNTPPPTDSDNEPMQPMNRRQRRMQEKDSRKEKVEKKPKVPKAKISPADTPTGITGPKKRVVAENGKILVVDAVGNVYLEQRSDDGELQELLLDPAELQAPRIRDTALVRLPLWVYAKTAGRFLSPTPPQDSDSDVDADADEFTSENDTSTDHKDGSSTGKATKRAKSRKSGRK